MTRGRARLYLISFFLQAFVAPYLVHDWDGFVFTRSVHDFLSGTTPYAVAEADPAYIHLSNAWPPLNTWYAYPPLPLLLMTPTLAAAFAAHAGAWAVRLALKLPFILGTLALAWVGAELLESWKKADRAETWERLVLLNPFLLFVSAAWGMFDAWMVAALLGSVLLIDRGRIRLAGVAFGASALIKLFPLFAAPAMVVYLGRRGPKGRADALRFTAWSAGAFAAVSLPFVAFHPRGFLLQVLQMHLARPPQGLSASAVLAEVARVAVDRGLWRGEPPLASLGALQTGATLVLLPLTAVAVARARTSLALVRCLLGILLGVLLTSKVLNEQYFVIPVAMYGLVFAASGDRWARNGYRAFWIGAFITSLLMGWHVLTFFPADVAVPLLGKEPHLLVGDLATVLGLGPPAFGLLPTAASFVLMLPAFVLGARRVVVEVRAGLRMLAVYLRRLLRRAPVRPTTRSLAAVFLVAPLLVAGSVLAAHRAPVASPLDSADRHVGAFYYLWWMNPSHDPGRADGNWREGVTESPQAGFYSVNAAKLRSDFHALRSKGADLVITSFHEYDLPVVPVALRAAYGEDLAIAPIIELGEVYSRPEYRSGDYGYTLDDRAARAIEDLIGKALPLFAAAPAAYRPGGKLAVFLYDAYFAGISWDASFSQGLAEHARALVEKDPYVGGGSEPVRVTDLGPPPTAMPALLDDRPLSAIWRRAYADLYVDFWRKIRADLEAKFGRLLLVSGESWNPGGFFHRGAQTAIDGMDVFDASFIYSPSFVWVFHKHDRYERNWQRWVVRNVLEAQYARAQGRPVIVTALPAYDDRAIRKKDSFTIPFTGPRGSTYDLTWGFALGLAPDLVLVSTYNEFFEGTAIEPTVEHGDDLMKSTAAWANRLRASPPGAARAKRALVVTGEASTHYTRGVVDPSVEGRYAHNLQLVAERSLPDYVIEAADVGGPALAATNLSKYTLVLLEPGLDVRSKAMAGFARRLEEWVRSGGRLLASGAVGDGPLAELVGVRAAQAEDDAASWVSVPTEEGRLALPPASRPLPVELAPDAEPLARYGDGHARGGPAAWVRDVGAGVVAGAAMHVTGRDTYPGADATALFCASIRPLLAAGDRCENPHPEIVP